MKNLVWFLLLVLLIPFAAGGCGKKTQEENAYVIKGKVTALDPAGKEVTLDHEDIPGRMKAMEMPFKVADGKILEGLKVGDLVSGKLSKENVILELRKR